VEFHKIKSSFLLALIITLLSAWTAATASAAELPFDTGWRFIREDVTNAQGSGYDDHAWQTVALPHTAHIEPLADGHEPRQWQGICWYRKSFKLPASAAGKDILLRFDGAMNAAEIWVNGQSAGKFMGGYLPYVINISGLVHAGEANVVAVRLDNRDNPITGPKPLADLDFNLYGGLYRDAHLIIQNKLHITDPILAATVAGGGVFVTFPSVSKTAATVQVKTQVQNDSDNARSFMLRTTLLDARGKTVATAESPATLAAGAEQEFTQDISVKNPKLWSPDSPCLYSVRSAVVEDKRTVDATQTRIGIRHLEITKDGFFINGEKMFLRGCNRHQEYPFIGNALSDAAQYRDALKIKEAGFDYVRCSHYPQSPAFLDACDELGLVVMDGILGWQYFNPNPEFAAQKIQECHQLIRRDRNHPCVILWELSLNESDMPSSFIKKASAIAHEEYPGDQCYTAGWKRGYDVFLQARQHGGCHGITNVPCLISEYGDWEYFAQNAGLEQGKWKDLKPADRSSRQLRGDGEVRMLQQALNFQEAHNDDLQTTAFGDGIWVMFDYARGYAPDLESSGVMDVFRLPKFSYWFFRSQRDPDEMVAGKPIGPVLFIANDWTPHSPRQVRIFSNCQEVSLSVNGQFIARQKPDASRMTTNLKHPPFTFAVPQFEVGTLKAVGYLNGKAVATSERRTPGDITQMALNFDLSGRPFARTGKDAVFCHVNLQDQNGTMVHTNGVPVFWGATGGLKLIGNQPAETEAGTATTLVAGDHARASGFIYSLCLLKEGDQTRILSTAGSPDDGRAPAFEIHYTTDGSEPSSSSPVYSQPVKSTPQLRAAIFAGGAIVAGTGTGDDTALR
jgi:beta-galactosidase